MLTGKEILKVLLLLALHGLDNLGGINAAVNGFSVAHQRVQKWVSASASVSVSVIVSVSG